MGAPQEFRCALSPKHGLDFELQTERECDEMLTYEQSQHGDITVLSISGNLDSLTVPEVRPVIEKIVASGIRKVALELSGLEVIDSSGIGAIVSLFKRVRGMSGDVKIVGVRGQPREILRLLGLERAFDIVPTLDEAARRFG